MTSEKKREAGFEQDLEKLEAIVESLEEGGLPLEKALKQFEVGIQLTRKCEKALRQAEQKIEMLVRGMDGELEAKPFDEEAAPSSVTEPDLSPTAARKKAAGPQPPPDDEPPLDEEPIPPYDGEEDEDDLDALF